jgi:HSP20 family protein
MSVAQRKQRREHDHFEVDPLTALVDTFFSSDRGLQMANRLSGWTGDIKVDSTETKDAFLIFADLPGVRKEDIKVSFDNHVLTIKAERRDENAGHDDDRKVHWKERSFGGVSRSFRLPKIANEKDAKCSFDNGVLSIRIGKKEIQSESHYLTVE